MGAQIFNLNYTGANNLTRLLDELTPTILQTAVSEGKDLCVRLVNHPGNMFRLTANTLDQYMTCFYNSSHNFYLQSEMFFIDPGMDLDVNLNLRSSHSYIKESIEFSKVNNVEFNPTTFFMDLVEAFSEQTAYLQLEYQKNPSNNKFLYYCAGITYIQVKNNDILRFYDSLLSITSAFSNKTNEKYSYAEIASNFYNAIVEHPLFKESSIINLRQDIDNISKISIHKDLNQQEINTFFRINSFNSICSALLVKITHDYYHKSIFNYLDFSLNLFSSYTNNNYTQNFLDDIYQENQRTQVSNYINTYHNIIIKSYLKKHLVSPNDFPLDKMVFLFYFYNKNFMDSESFHKILIDNLKLVFDEKNVLKALKKIFSRPISFILQNSYSFSEDRKQLLKSYFLFVKSFNEEIFYSEIVKLANGKVSANNFGLMTEFLLEILTAEEITQLKNKLAQSFPSLYTERVKTSDFIISKNLISKEFEIKLSDLLYQNPNENGLLQNFGVFQNYITAAYYQQGVQVFPFTKHETTIKNKKTLQTPTSITFILIAQDDNNLSDDLFLFFTKQFFTLSNILNIDIAVFARESYLEYQLLAKKSSEVKQLTKSKI